MKTTLTFRVDQEIVARFDTDEKLHDAAAQALMRKLGANRLDEENTITIGNEASPITVTTILNWAYSGDAANTPRR